MSEKIQHTANSTRLKMKNRYGIQIHHKHNKDHFSYRQHWKTYTNQRKTNNLDEQKDENKDSNIFRAFKLRSVRKRAAKGGQFH